MVALLGLLVLAVGIVAIPYPGPGWLIVFAGLAILASEFTWARRVLEFGRARYDAWTDWLRRQHWAVRVVVLAATAVVVVATLWLVNAFGIVGGWLGLDQAWLNSPLV